MPKKESFSLVVETTAYRNGIVTRNAGMVNEGSRYGLEKLSEALYTSSNACVERHGEMEILDKRSELKGSKKK